MTASEIGKDNTGEQTASGSPRNTPDRSGQVICKNKQKKIFLSTLQLHTTFVSFFDINV